MKRLYVPRATVPLIFALVMALAFIVYVFSWGSYRSQQPATSVVVAPATAIADVEASGIAPRSFVLDGARWRQEGLETTEGRPVATDSAEGRRITEAVPQLEALLTNGRTVLLSWEGGAVEVSRGVSAGGG